MPAPPRRVFAAIFPSAEAVEFLEQLKVRLAPTLPGLRWVAPANLHYTLRFLGDRSDDEVEAAGRALDRVAAATRPFRLEFAGVNVFPDWRRPRVLWIGAGQGGAILEAFARMLEREFLAEGLGGADKPFVAHLTLGRWRDRPDLSPPARDAARLEPAGGAFEVRDAAIVHSMLGSRGSTYAPIHVAPLIAPP